LQNNEILENLIKFHKEAALPGSCLHAGRGCEEFCAKIQMVPFCNIFLLHK